MIFFIKKDFLSVSLFNQYRLPWFSKNKWMWIQSNVKAGNLLFAIRIIELIMINEFIFKLNNVLLISLLNAVFRDNKW